MKPNEFVAKMQMDWSRRFSPSEAKECFAFASRYTPEELDQIREHLLHMGSGTYFRPQLILAAANESGVMAKRIQPGRKKTLGDPRCTQCRGAGWEYVGKGVRRCVCRDEASPRGMQGMPGAPWD